MFYTHHNRHTTKLWPHQPNDLKPEATMLATQTPPARLSGREKRAALSAPAPQIKLEEAPTDVHIGPPKPTIFPARPVILNDSQASLSTNKSWLAKILNQLGIKRALNKPSADATLALIMNFLKKHRLITVDEAARLTELRPARVRKYLKLLVKQNLISQQKSGPKTFYKLIQKTTR